MGLAPALLRMSPPPRHLSPAVALALLCGCTGQVMDARASGGGGGPAADDETVEPARPGLEFECDEPVPDPGPRFVRRLTLPEYVNTVEGAIGVDVGADAAELLPKDLRADGFGNTAAALVVTLGHVEAYEALARIAVSRIADMDAFLSEHVSCREFTAECEGELLDAVGRRLYRAPLDATEREALLGIFDVVESEGEGFAVAAGLVLEAMLQSPRFLYRIENERGDGSIRGLDGWEVASRLSYLLWNAPPDDALFAAAETGALATDAEIEAQVRRMLDDPRARDASMRYLSDWLNLGRLNDLPRDPEHHPDWDPQLGRDMQAETRAFFEHVVWDEQRPLLDLFDAQVTFVTPELAAWYGMEPAGDGVSQIDLSAMPERGGILTQGTVLTVGGDEGSMVARGLFLLESILCGKLDSPPPGIDTTPPETMPGSSQRVYSEDRVNSEVCGGCHQQMEPLAWGLERFDGTGAYHLEDEFGNALQQDGRVLVPGDTETTPYDTVAELMEILSESDRVRDCMTLKATQFAMGRPLVETDGCSLARTRERLAATDGTYGDLIVSIATSPMFRTIRTE